MTATAIVLALALIASPIDTAVSAVDGSCGSYSSRVTPPRHILVFRLHRRGSTIPARVERWGFRKYVGMVMRSGAWPGRPWASARVGAIAIKQYAWWMKLHHQPGHSFRGRCYDITDSEQYLAPWVRPDDRAPVLTRRAVNDTWPVSLRKNGRFFRTGWSGGLQYDHWHLGEDSVRAAAQRGWGWHRIIRTFLSPVTIVGDGR